ncbi:MAG: Lrp/AsnC family transcriptional regulator [Desulfobacteraceae bacterium]|nr:Lrp/AsnC family transcriptional regulator [Desulfobacteraceae bacterium]
MTTQKTTNTLTQLEKKVIASLQGDIPVIERPFLKLAQDIGITEEEFLKVMNNLDDRGLIRRFGATLKHQNSGYNANAMVAWIVDDKKAIETGKIMATFKEVSHCYRRTPVRGWDYSRCTMGHASEKEECYAIVNKISKAVNIDKYAILFSKKELKKTSMKYFV